MEFTSPIDFAKMYIDIKHQYLPIERFHIDFLNQFLGTTISEWRTDIRVSEDDLFNCFQSSLFPDYWLKNLLSGNKVALKILTMPSQKKKKERDRS